MNREESHSWSSAPVLKTGTPQGVVSSNLTSSVVNYELIISFISIIIAVLAWHKNRVVYGIEQITDRQGDKLINEKLQTGKYTILHIKQDGSNELRTIYILGRIKK